MLTALAFVLSLTAASFAAKASQPPSDVLLISIDNLRADRVRPDLMPNVWELSRESVRFTSAYSQATWTLPAHVSLLTSLYPASHGAGESDNVPRAMFSGVLDLAQILHERGYRAVSYTNGMFFLPIFRVIEGFAPQVLIPAINDPVPSALRWFMRTAPPVFLFLHDYGVHNFIIAVDTPQNNPASWRCPPKLMKEKRHRAKKFSCKELPIVYDRAVYCVDKSLGAMFNDLKASGRWRGMLIVVTSDHGESLCDGPKEAPRRWHALSPFDERIHVPLFVKLPDGRFAGREMNSPAELIDVAPTILDILQLPIPSQFQGRSLLPRLIDDSLRQKVFPVFADSDNCLMVSLGGWKLLRPMAAPAQLYDLSSDPGETRNLARSEHGRFQELQSLLRDHYGRQRIGWRIAVQGRVDTHYTLIIRSDKKLALSLTAFTESDDRLIVAENGTMVRVEFSSESDGDEDWLIVETSTPTAQMTLGIFRDDRPPPAGSVRLGKADLPGQGPWLLSDPEIMHRGVLSSPPTPVDGVSLWRANGNLASPQFIDAAPGVLKALRAAGYLR